MQSSQPSWKASAPVLYFPPDPPLSMEHCSVPILFQITVCKTPSPPSLGSRPFLGPLSGPEPAESDATTFASSCQSTMVGWCQHLLQYWHSSSEPVGDLEMVTGFSCGPKTQLQHWLGWGCSDRAWPLHGHPPGPLLVLRPFPGHFPGSLQQFWCCCGHKQRLFLWQGDKHYPQACISAPSPSPCSTESCPCCRPWQHIRHPFKGGHPWFPARLPFCILLLDLATTIPPLWQISPRVMPISIKSSHAPLDDGATSLNPSPLYPFCWAEVCIFLWKGVNPLPLSTIADPTICLITSQALCASLWDSSASGYSLGIWKFHLFCDIFTIPEVDCLPASFKLVHSFALWAATDPSTFGPGLPTNVQFEPGSISIIKKYLATICAWHLTQGW